MIVTVPFQGYMENIYLKLPHLPVSSVFCRICVQTCNFLTFDFPLIMVNSEGRCIV